MKSESAKPIGNEIKDLKNRGPHGMKRGTAGTSNQGNKIYFIPYLGLFPEGGNHAYVNQSKKPTRQGKDNKRQKKNQKGRVEVKNHAQQREKRRLQHCRTVHFSKDPNTPYTFISGGRTIAGENYEGGPAKGEPPEKRKYSRERFVQRTNSAHRKPADHQKNLNPNAKRGV